MVGGEDNVQAPVPGRMARVVWDGRRWRRLGPVVNPADQTHGRRVSDGGTIAHVHVPEDSEVIVVPKRRRVVTVPRWLPIGTVWLGMRVGVLVVLSLTVFVVFFAFAHDDDVCEAQRRTATAIARAHGGPLNTPDVQDGLARVAREIRRNAGNC